MLGVRIHREDNRPAGAPGSREEVDIQEAPGSREEVDIREEAHNRPKAAVCKRQEAAVCTLPEAGAVYRGPEAAVELPPPATHTSRKSVLVFPFRNSGRMP